MCSEGARILRVQYSPKFSVGSAQFYALFSILCIID